MALQPNKRSSIIRCDRATPFLYHFWPFLTKISRIYLHMWDFFVPLQRILKTLQITLFIPII